MTFISRTNRWFYFWFTLPLWSAFINILYIIRYFYKIPAAIKDMNVTRKNLWWHFYHPPISGVKNLDNYAAAQCLRAFAFKRDLFYDWYPWTITLFIRKADDCDGLSRAMKWAWKQLGVPSSIYILIGERESHAVCVRDDHKAFATNGQIIEIPAGLENEEFVRYITDCFVKGWYTDIFIL